MEEKRNAEPRASWVELIASPWDPAWTRSFSVEIRATAGEHPHRLHVTYRVTGPVPDLALPAANPARKLARHQTLWQQTCFEVFAAPTTGAHYAEWNLSSSTEWGHFRFTDYRVAAGTQEDFDGGVRDVVFRRSASSLELSAAIDLSCVPEFAGSAPRSLRLGLTCILVNKRGEKSYWALRHTGTQPDFHRTDSFALSFP